MPPPPPLLFLPPSAGFSQVEQPGTRPGANPVKEQPVIIKGYRFRPVQQERKPNRQSPEILPQK
ncbi:MAG: hypothetical protein ABW092_07380 [Candidatus Thiodiazotropha sp.]